MLVQRLSLEPKTKYTLCLFSESSGRKWHQSKLLTMREEHLLALNTKMTQCFFKKNWIFKNWLVLYEGVNHFLEVP